MCQNRNLDKKKLDQKEINRIIEEEEKWQKEHGGDKEEETKETS